MARFFSKNARWEYSRHLLPFLPATGGTLHLSLALASRFRWVGPIFYILRLRLIQYVIWYGRWRCGLRMFICKANKYALARQTPVIRIVFSNFIFRLCSLQPVSVERTDRFIFEIKMTHTHTHTHSPACSTVFVSYFNGGKNRLPNFYCSRACTKTFMYFLYVDNNRLTILYLDKCSNTNEQINKCHSGPSSHTHSLPSGMETRGEAIAEKPIE